MSMNPVPAFLDVSSPWLREPGNRDALRVFLANNKVNINNTVEIHFKPKEMTIHYYLDTPPKSGDDGEIRIGSRTVTYITPPDILSPPAIPKLKLDP